MEEKSSTIFKQEAVQLIDFKGDKFVLNEDAMEILASIEEDIIIVSVVGKARTGKSYLMNLLLDNIGKNQGFQVDSKISSCTKGIWLWGTPKSSISTPNAKIIFIDSEGTSSTDRSTKTYDARIFALVVLISSLFIYNTTSNIDEFGISELSLASHLSNSVTTNSGLSKDTDNLLTELAPKFIWVLRDFTLEKRHPETNQEMTSKEYLELCLRKKISGKNSNDNNLIRDNIIKYFPERDCITLTRPIDSETDLRNLNNIPLKSLKSGFKMEFQYLKDKVYKDTQPKRMNGKKMNGSDLARFINEIVITINSNAIPNINNSWDKVVMDDIVNYKNKSLSFFKESLKKINDNYRMKTENLNIKEKDEISKILYDLKLESQMKFNKILNINQDILINSTYSECFLNNRSGLETDIDKLISRNLEDNDTKCENYCIKLLRDKYKDIEKKIYDDMYEIKNLEDLNDDYGNLLEKYQDESKGTKKLTIFNDFIAKTVNRNLFEYLNKILNKNVNSKVQEFDYKIKSASEEIEDLELEIQRMNDTIKNKLEFDIGNKENELKRHETEIDYLQKDIEDMNNKLQNLKEENMQREMKELTSKIIPQNVDETKSIVKDDTSKPNKKKGGGCHCNVY